MSERRLLFFVRELCQLALQRNICSLQRFVVRLQRGDHGGKVVDGAPILLLPLRRQRLVFADHLCRLCLRFVVERLQMLQLLLILRHRLIQHTLFVRHCRTQLVDAFAALRCLRFHSLLQSLEHLAQIHHFALALNESHIFALVARLQLRHTPLIHVALRLPAFAVLQKLLFFARRHFAEARLVQFHLLHLSLKLIARTLRFAQLGQIHRLHLAHLAIHPLILPLKLRLLLAELCLLPLQRLHFVTQSLLHLRPLRTLFLHLFLVLLCQLTHTRLILLPQLLHLFQQQRALVLQFGALHIHKQFALILKLVHLLQIIHLFALRNLQHRLEALQ
mmetsp:Transcript_4217/g.7180  ORF Transcript_4217/g.7180 Transcript_4217/m.7180 type:complete len:333 (-) Transcript_4217:341-1339(-)